MWAPLRSEVERNGWAWVETACTFLQWRPKIKMLKANILPKFVCLFLEVTWVLTTFLCLIKDWFLAIVCHLHQKIESLAASHVGIFCTKPAQQNTKTKFYWSNTNIQHTHCMMKSSNGVTGPMWGEFTGHRWITQRPVTLWCFLWSAPEQTFESTI